MAWIVNLDEMTPAFAEVDWNIKNAVGLYDIIFYYQDIQ